MSFTNSKTPKGRGGRPSDPNKLRFQSIGLTPAHRDYLRLFRLNYDLPPPEQGTPEDNPTAQLALLIEQAMRFWPDGPKIARPRRGALGHWMSNAEIQAARAKEHENG